MLEFALIPLIFYVLVPILTVAIAFIIRNSIVQIVKHSETMNDLQKKHFMRIVNVLFFGFFIIIILAILVPIIAFVLFNLTGPGQFYNMPYNMISLF